MPSSHHKSAITYPERSIKSHEDDEFEEKVLTTIDLNIKSTSSTYFFDHVFDHNTSQNGIFEAIRPFFQSALDGDQVCILAYGQTGSGKTYTLEGPNLRNDVEINNSSGILPRAVDFVFKEVERVRSLTNIQIQMAAVEIYNETLHDLLAGESESSDKGAADKLSINFIKNRVNVKGLQWIKIENNTQMLSLVAKASNNRSTDRTGWNDR